MFIVVQTFAIESRLQQCLIACFLCKQMTQTSLNVCTLYFTADKQPAAVAYMFCVLFYTAGKRPAARRCVSPATCMASLPWGVVIIDESHNLRTTNSKQKVGKHSV